VPYNPKEQHAQELFELLESIAHYIEEKIQLYALGGTALTILGIKLSTLDIDINIHSKKQYDYLCQIFKKIGFRRIGTIRWQTHEGIHFDLFHGSNILGTQLLPDCLTESTLIKTIGKINLYTLSPYNIMISKLARGDERDFIDIKQLLEHQKIDLKKLAERYQQTMNLSAVGQYKQKLLDLIEIKFTQWGYKINKELIQEVNKWAEQ
jgi:hypothetical protein